MAPGPFGTGGAIPLYTGPPQVPYGGGSGGPGPGYAEDDPGSAGRGRGGGGVYYDPFAGSDRGGPAGGFVDSAESGFAPAMGRGGGGPLKRPPGPSRDGDWTCEAEGCGNVNFARRKKCNRCGEPREKDDPVHPNFPKDHPIFKDGDWKCPM